VSKLIKNRDTRFWVVAITATVTGLLFDYALGSKVWFGYTAAAFGLMFGVGANGITRSLHVIRDLCASHITNFQFAITLLNTGIVMVVAAAVAATAITVLQPKTESFIAYAVLTIASAVYTYVNLGTED